MYITTIHLWHTIFSTRSEGVMGDNYVPWALVKTNEIYAEKNKREVIGRIVEPGDMELTDSQVIVKWITQTGENINSTLDRQMVLMSKVYLTLI